jgi:hypothetical protein
MWSVRSEALLRLFQQPIYLSRNSTSHMSSSASRACFSGFQAESKVSYQDMHHLSRTLLTSSNRRTLGCCHPPNRPSTYPDPSKWCRENPDRHQNRYTVYISPLSYSNLHRPFPHSYLCPPHLPCPISLPHFVSPSFKYSILPPATPALPELLHFLFSS